MTAPSTPDIAAAYQAQTASVRAGIVAYLTNLWRSLGYYGSKEQAQFVKQAVPIVRAGQSQMSALTVGYLSAQRQQAIGRSLATRVNPASVSGAAARNGADPSEVYGRPFHLVWRQLGDLKQVTPSGQELPQADIDSAIQAGLDRANQTALTDLQLTKVQTAQKTMEHDPKITGYRRVLEGPYSCGLCIIASTQRYHKGTLMPIHPACDCSVDPIYGGNPDQQVIDSQTLTQVHDAIAERFGRDSAAARKIPGQYINGKPVMYRDVLVTHEHGELGPVLSVKGAPFQGPSDL